MTNRMGLAFFLMFTTVLIAGCQKDDSGSGDDPGSTKPPGGGTARVVLNDAFKNNNNKWFVGTSATNALFSATLHGAADGLWAETYELNYGDITTIGGYEYAVFPRDIFTAGAKKYTIECAIGGAAFSEKRSNSFYYGLVINLDKKTNRHTSFLLSTSDNFAIYQGKADGSSTNVPLKGWTAYTPQYDGLLLQKMRIEVTADGKGRFFINNKLLFSGTVGKMKPDRIAFVVSGGMYCAIKSIKATQEN
ncbi:hypothetical protein [Niabella drilacis]|uniref:3-keto-disaccharide hydrolase domain-containing protein n=1 Tax=Niabella drilacis (strain DSM 25811 / CCM 8410 / CCUG 62505 / LMG 26954 / E90) TaxID=1285928 RepID=A0A1G6YCC0_NIADE|nr:hypothetical protein [Niabella drilacis]SDD87245.1 hypothetical protein SAMN04487894_11539 [Niabella drilacis]